jgi:hypothetical protein
MTIRPNTSLVLGPISVPIYGDPVTVDGITSRPVTGYVPGSHWNIARTRLTPALEAYEVTPDPDTPIVIWAGDVRLPDGAWRDTAFLKFASDAQALAALLAAGLASDVPA